LSGYPRFGAVFGYMLPWLLFGIWCVVSTCWSPLKQISLFQSVSFLSVLLVGWVTGILVSGSHDVSRILATVTVTLIAICTGLLVLRFAAPQFGALSRTALGLFHSTNGGCTAGLGLVILVAARCLWGWPWTRRMLVPGAIVFIATLFVANNRLSIAMATLLTTGVWLWMGNRLLLALAVLLGTTAGALYLALDPGLQLVGAVTGTAGEYLLQGQSDTELGSFSGRTQMWRAMWNSFQESPWIGHGYFVTSARGEMYVWYQWNNWTAHNLFLQLATTTGLVGIILFLVALVSTGAALIQQYLFVPAERKTVAFCIIVATWWFGWGILNESILGPLEPETVIFGVLVGIAAAAAAVPAVRSRVCTARVLPAAVTVPAT
jgi:O-antigen ligase